MLLLSVSVCSSVVLDGRPQTCCSLRPLTGLGAFGPPKDAPGAAVWTSPDKEEWLRSGKRTQVVPQGGLEHVLAKGPLVSSNVNRPDQWGEVWACGVNESREPASSLPA